MNEAIDIYCERMSDAFWAEPVNAITNGAFLIAAVILALQLRDRKDRLAWVLTGLVFLIGIGSFLFHTFATGWAAAADVIPIMLFMLTAVGVCLHRRFQLPGQAVGLGVAIFVFFNILVGWSRLGLIIPNGSSSYVPALLTLLLFALVLWRRGDLFAPFFGLATLVFAVSLTLRTIDLPVCDAVPIGTHFLWHVLNAVTLYLVTRGLMRAPSPVANAA
ncbi:MAG: ceramidase domain-containing protein [Pseudomonadota bacterium]